MTSPADKPGAASMIEWLREHAPDCGDNSCLFGGRGKGGMRTNGGCRCYKDVRPDMRRIYIERMQAALSAPSATVPIPASSGKTAADIYNASVWALPSHEDCLNAVHAAGVREGLERALEICCIIGDENVANTDEANGAEKCERSIRARLTASPGNGQATTNAAPQVSQEIGTASMNWNKPAEAAPSHGGQSERQPSTQWKFWREAKPFALGPYYCYWVSHLTSEGLHEKDDIATVLAILHQQRDDMQGDALRLHREKMDALFGPDGKPRSSTPPSQPAEGPTPETDAIAGGHSLGALEDHARTLERQRDDARRDLADLQQLYGAACQQLQARGDKAVALSASVDSLMDAKRYEEVVGIIQRGGSISYCPHRLEWLIERPEGGTSSVKGSLSTILDDGIRAMEKGAEPT